MRLQKIIKHGNSLAVVIPRDVCKDLGFRAGDHMRLSVEEVKDEYDNPHTCAICFVPERIFKISGPEIREDKLKRLL